MKVERKPKITIILFSGILLGLLIAVFLQYRSSLTRHTRLLMWLRQPEKYSVWAIESLGRCEGAPFLLPTEGYIGYIWDDSFRIGHRHQGIDIFGGHEPGITSVYAAYDGYLTRQTDWKSTVIIRIPSDPLQKDRQIWLYYTHLADQNGKSYISEGFPPGTKEKQVKAGELLGYQGNYSGDMNNPVGVHLHFSIVMDDGNSNYLNELKIQNTIDPSSYLGIDVNRHSASSNVPVCP